MVLRALPGTAHLLTNIDKTAITLLGERLLVTAKISAAVQKNEVEPESMQNVIVIFAQQSQRAKIADVRTSSITCSNLCDGKRRGFAPLLVCDGYGDVSRDLSRSVMRMSPPPLAHCARNARLTNEGETACTI
jgi:hypothetical protein